MTVFDNQFLRVKPSVRLSPQMIPVILGLEKYFQEAGVVAWVTSGIRNSMDQLNTIVKYCKKYHVDNEFPEVLTCLPTDKRKDGKYVWQPAWSRLLNIGVIINPPFPAVCLFDYYSDGKNKKGRLIGHSPHYYGNGVDIGGGVDHDISNELPPVQRALADKLPGLKSYLVERKNNCIHLNVELIQPQPS